MSPGLWLSATRIGVRGGLATICQADVSLHKGCQTMSSSEDEPSEMEFRYSELFLMCTVGLQEQDSSDFIGQSQILCDLQFGWGKALNIELEH